MNGSASTWDRGWNFAGLVTFLGSLKPSRMTGGSAMLDTLDKRKNRLLAALEAPAQGLLLARRSVAGARGPGRPRLFPVERLGLARVRLEDRQMVETAPVVGREGAVGAFAGLGPWHAFTRATVQIPATIAVISTSYFQAAVSRSERIRDLILRYKEALLGQVQQTAACNALHELEPREPTMSCVRPKWPAHLSKSTITAKPESYSDDGGGYRCSKS